MRPDPRVLVFDSGLGGLTVFARLAQMRPDGDYVYIADDEGFPYGALSEAALVARVVALMRDLIVRHAPDLVVIACNTASTLVLPHLRAGWPQLPFVGTVPAVKPAAAASRSGLVSVLATPGTVTRDYTRALIRDHAGAVEVKLVGSARLAPLAEAFMQGRPAPDDAIAAEIAPCFVEREAMRTDAIALACTHYPLLLEAFARLAPWPVTWIDPAPAIARRVDHVLREHGFGPAPRGAREGVIEFTSGATPSAALEKALRFRGLAALGCAKPTVAMTPGL